MKALLSKVAGGPETLVLEDVAEPKAGVGEVLIGIRACAINFPDVLVIEDKYQFKPARPFAPGGEISGVIEAVGQGVTGWKVGDRVIAATGSTGGLAERIATDAGRLYALPPERSFAEGASLMMTYGTSIHALLDRGRIVEGETLLVLGAAGGVGLAAIELGKAFGARVVGAVSNEAKAQAARDAGADDVVIYPQGPFDRDQSKALANAFKAAVGPDGADVIYDAVGGDYADPAIRSIAWEGRYLVVGFPAGIPKLPLNLTLLKAATSAACSGARSRCASQRPIAITSSGCSGCGKRARSRRASPIGSRSNAAAMRSPKWPRAGRSASWWSRSASSDCTSAVSPLFLL